MLGISDERGGLQAIPLFCCCALRGACGIVLVSLERQREVRSPASLFLCFLIAL